MKAIVFKECNRVLVAPDCFDLPVRVAGGVVTSAWQLEPEDIRRLAQNGGVIYLQVFSGVTSPPVNVTTDPVL